MDYSKIKVGDKVYVSTEKTPYTSRRIFSAWLVATLRKVRKTGL